MHTQTYTINNTAPAFNHSNEPAKAAIVECDITPPPGLAKAGYAMLTTSSMGVRVKLKAKVVYVRDGKGQSLALIQSDLHAGSLLIQRLVAEHVAPQTDLHAGNLFHTATHTHASPGNFYESNFYNKNASNEQWLDPQLVAFLVSEISQAVIDAYHSATEAKIATGKKAVFGLARNRSIKAWLNNPQHHNKHHNDTQALCLQAVNPDLFMLRIDLKTADGQFIPAGSYTLFSAHCTTLTALNTLNTADVFGIAHRVASTHIQSQYQLNQRPISAIAAGTQGDQNPNVPWQGDNWFSHLPVDWKAAKALGEQVGKAVSDLFVSLESALTENITLNVASSWTDLRNTEGDFALAPYAAVGNGTSSGAQERRTPWLAALPFLRAGSPLASRKWRVNGPHGNKRILGFMFQQYVEKRKDFPYFVQLSIAKINDLAIVPLPFEVSVEAGAHIANTLRSHAPDCTHIGISSLGNGYTGYMTTPDEYAIQEYEGSSTLYGPNSAPYIAQQLGQLASRLESNVIDLPASYHVSLNAVTRFPENENNTVTNPNLNTPRLQRATIAREEDTISIAWEDVCPAQMQFNAPMACVEVLENEEWQPLTNNGMPISDEGIDLAILYHGKLTLGHQYEARWMSPRTHNSKSYRFAIRHRGRNEVIYSSAF